MALFPTSIIWQRAVNYFFSNLMLHKLDSLVTNNRSQAQFDEFKSFHVIHFQSFLDFRLYSCLNHIVGVDRHARPQLKQHLKKKRMDHLANMKYQFFVLQNFEIISDIYLIYPLGSFYIRKKYLEKILRLNTKINYRTQRQQVRAGDWREKKRGLKDLRIQLSNLIQNPRHSLMQK